MPRPVIQLPEKFNFSTTLQARITDVNYGGHVGNDTILSYLHEARLQYLQQLGYSETDIGGKGMIMGNVSIIYKNELFYPEAVRVWVTVGEISGASFVLYYKMEKYRGDDIIVVAEAQTGMVCFDYGKRKVSPLPDAVRERFQADV